MSEFLKEYCIRCDRRELPAQLHPDKNGDLTLDEIAGGRMSLVSLSPHLVDQWHPEKNGPLRPEQVLSGSNRKVWWKCSKGHEWQASIKSRTGAQKCGCPVCAGKTPRSYK